MDDSPRKLNFVERRIQTDKVLRENAEAVWQDFRSSIQDCCESYERYFSGTLQFKRENGHRIRIEKTFLPNGYRRTKETTCLSISYNDNEYTIEVVGKLKHVATLRISSDERTAFLADSRGSVIDDIDRACEICLSDFIFVEDPPRSPALNNLAQ